MELDISNADQLRGLFRKHPHLAEVLIGGNTTLGPLWLHRDTCEQIAPGSWLESAVNDLLTNGAIAALCIQPSLHQR